MTIIRDTFIFASLVRHTHTQVGQKPLLEKQNICLLLLVVNSKYLTGSTTKLFQSTSSTSKAKMN